MAGDAANNYWWPFVKFFQYKLKLKSRILAIVAVIISASLIIGIAAALVVPSVAQEAERTLNLMRTHIIREKAMFAYTSFMD